MSNLTLPSDPLPPLSSYSLSPQPPLVPGIPDKLAILILPIIAYWAVSLFFHWIDTNDYLPQYRLHTPAEVLKRNHVSQADVIKDVIIQQIIQTFVGWLLGLSEPDEFVGREAYDVAVWARRIRVAQKLIPTLLSGLGIDATGLATKMSSSNPMLAGAIAGGYYPLQVVVVDNGLGSQVLRRTFANWEMTFASALYWYIVPVLQFAVAIFFVDTWQYFLHRAMHVNLWLYRTFHSRHHRLYVPYAFGALYNHPFEGFLLDTCGAGLAFKVAGMTTRQGMWFFTCSTIKTVDDHCGYALPWDPLQHLTSNNAGYHDVHHQSWGVKTNFSQPFFTFWDRVLGTVWTGGDVSLRYERAAKAAQKKVDVESERSSTTVETVPLSPSPDSKAEEQAAASRSQIATDTQNGGPKVIAEEVEEERTEMAKRRPRKRSSAQSASLKGLRERVNGSLHGRSGGVLGMESSG